MLRLDVEVEGLIKLNLLEKSRGFRRLFKRSIKFIAADQPEDNFVTKGFLVIDLLEDR